MTNLKVSCPGEGGSQSLAAQQCFLERAQSTDERQGLSPGQHAGSCIPQLLKLSL